MKQKETKNRKLFFTVLLVVLIVVALCVPAFADSVSSTGRLPICDHSEHTHGSDCIYSEDYNDGEECLLEEHTHSSDCYINPSKFQSMLDETAELAEATENERFERPVTYGVSGTDILAINHSSVTKVYYGEVEESYLTIKPNSATEVEWWFDGGYSASDVDQMAESEGYGTSGSSTNEIHQYAKITDVNMSGHIGHWVTSVGSYLGQQVDLKITYYWTAYQSTVYPSRFPNGYVPVRLGVSTYEDLTLGHMIYGHTYEVKYELYDSTHTKRITPERIRVTFTDIDLYQYYGFKANNGSVADRQVINDVGAGIVSVNYYTTGSGYEWFYDADGNEDTTNLSLSYAASVVFSNCNSFNIIYGTSLDQSSATAQLFPRITSNVYSYCYGSKWVYGSNRESTVAYYNDANDSSYASYGMMIYREGAGWTSQGFGITLPSAPFKHTEDIDEVYYYGTDGNTLSKDEYMSYVITQDIPTQGGNTYKFSKFTLEDTLPDAVTITSTPHVYVQGLGDVSSLFTITVSGNNVLFEASSTLLNNQYYYGWEYNFYINVQLKTSAVVADKYKVATNHYQFTNTATSNFTVDTTDTTYTKDSNTVYTNYYTKTLNLTKAWVDTEDTDDYRPSSVTFYVKNGSTTVETVTLTKANSWKASVVVPKYDHNKNDITYTISEASVADYTGSVSGTTITNTADSCTITAHKAVVPSTDSKAGFKFQLTGTSVGGKTISITKETDSSGNVTFTPPAGTYTITEIDVPDKYDVSAALGPKTVAKGASVDFGTITNTGKSGTITVQKSTDPSGSLSGFTFKLTGTSASGQAVTMTATTDSNGVATFNNVPIGTKCYTIEEINVPLKYYIPNPLTEISVESGKTTNAGTIENRETITYIEKVDQDGNALAGAVLECRDSNGTLMSKWTTTTTPKTLRGLERGKTYYITEVSAPSGYFYNSETVEFTVDNAISQVITFTNKITVTKVTKVNESGAGLAGAKLQVLTKAGILVDEWTSTTSAHEIKGLVAGEIYTLKEVSPASGYATAASINFTVKTDGTDTVVRMTDKQTVFAFLKKSQDGDNLADAKLAVYDTNNNLIDQWTTTTGYHYVKGLVVGKTYILKEIAAPYNYTKAADIRFTVSDTEDTQYVTMTNMLDVVDFSFKKVNAQFNVLPGAEYTLYSCSNITHDHSDISTYDTGCWTAAQTVTSGSDGKITFTDLTATRTYAIVETKAPDGYNLVSGYWTITYDESVSGVEGPAAWQVTSEGTTINLVYSTATGTAEWTMTNYPKFLLPQAGGEGHAMHVAFGIGTMLFATMALSVVLFKKKQKSY